MTKFVHLSLQSDHSLLQGTVRVKKLADNARKAGYPAIAVTNKNSMFDALQFSISAYEAGIQPILGCQVTVMDGEASGPMILLAQNEAGWLSLGAISEKLWMRGDGHEAHVTIAEIIEHSDGVICLTGGADGPLGRLIHRNHAERAKDLAIRLKDAFGDRLYIEIQRHPDEHGTLPELQEKTEPAFLDIAYDNQIPIVATNDVRFLRREDYEAHDALICIGDKTYIDQSEPRRRFTPEHYLKSPEEMAELFADLPEALENTVEIARRSAFAAYKRNPILPKFSDDEVEELRRQAREGLEKRLEIIPLAVSREAYHERLDYELGIIERMGFPGYFLIVSDFIKWAKINDIPVGPGRGSGAGSLVAYALTVTDLDPIRYGLLFERFLNPERVSMPDFDIDFCMDRRTEVIDYVRGKYGEDRVGQIVTFGGMLSKAAVRDVGRVMQLPHGRVDRLSKMIPVEGVKPVSITKARGEEQRIKDEEAADPQIKKLFDIAEELDGVFRNASTHAAGVVIGDRPLEQLVPIYKDPESSMPATQFNMKWVEAAGLVKFDFLGLKTLTVIQRALKYISQSGIEVDISRIPVDDEITFDLFSSANTAAVFQVESAGMMDALRRMRPTCIEDIIALVALYRPGPMENIPTYCEVKNGLRPLASVHPSIDHILEETQGIIVYQEQVMQVAQVMAGYSLGGADLLRRAMGKKIAEEMAKERPKFVDGSVANGVDERKAGEVFDLLEKFANYGFNKSHAAAYALISYQTAWLKANFPAEFMAAVMSCDAHNTDKLAGYRAEVIRMGIDLESPSINMSGSDFAVRDGKIFYSLAALKRVGEGAVKPIEAERDANGPYRDMADLARRVDLVKVGKMAMEAMARAGAFDCFDPNRAYMMAQVGPAMTMSRNIRDKSRKAAVEQDLFAGMGGVGDMAQEKIKINPVNPWNGSEKFAAEAIAVGFYLSGHPLDDRMQDIRTAGMKTWGEVAADNDLKDTTVKFAATVMELEEKKSSKGGKFGFLKLSDPSGNYETTVFGDVLEKQRDLLVPGQDLIVRASVERNGETLRLSVRSIEPLPTLEAVRKKAVEGKPRRDQKEAKIGSAKITIDDPQSLASVVALLGKPGENRGPVTIHVMGPGINDGTTVNQTGNLSGNILDLLREIPGVSVETMVRELPRIGAAKADKRPPAEPRLGL